MEAGASSFIDTVGTIWIWHDGKRLIRRHQRINQRFGALVVDIVVACAMDYEQLTLELAGKRDWRALLILVRVILRQPAVTLLIDRIVETKIGHRRYRHSYLIDIRVTKHRIQSC